MAARPDPYATTSSTADDARRELEVAIEHPRRGAADIDDLRSALGRFCTQARREQVPPERLLIAVKAALDGLPAQAVDPPGLRDSIRQRIVSLAIRTYYADSGPDEQDRSR